MFLTAPAFAVRILHEFLTEVQGIMKKRDTEFNEHSQRNDRMSDGARSPVLAYVMRRLGEITGALLGGVAVSAQIGNILICLFIILWGPAFIIGLFKH